MTGSDRECCDVVDRIVPSVEVIDGESDVLEKLYMVVPHEEGCNFSDIVQCTVIGLLGITKNANVLDVSVLGVLLDHL